MARTKQTSRKSTGGQAPRVNLPAQNLPEHVAPPIDAGNAKRPIKTLVNISNAAQVAKANSSQAGRSTEDWCYICVNGGRALACDRCPRIVCTDHFLALPTNMALDEAAFLCPVCHEEVFDCAHEKPYMAFYHDLVGDSATWMPLLSRPAMVQGSYSMSRKSRVLKTPTLILHFVLKGITTSSLPPAMMFLAMKEYFPDSHLEFIEVAFDLIEQPEAHLDAVIGFIQKISRYERIVVFITNHSHDETGDMYGGPDASADSEQVFDLLLPSCIRDALVGRQVYLMILACGAFVDNLDPRTALMKLAHRIHASDIIAFSSTRLIPSLTTPFWLDFTVRVLIEGFPLEHALPQMLACTTTSPVVRHTNIVVCRVPSMANDPFLYSEYVWSHPELRPFGRRLPITCPSCGCLTAFGKPIKYTVKDQPTVYTFQCSGATMLGERCAHELKVTPMEGFNVYGSAHNGARWMVKTDEVYL